jgi:hypothetical protein
MGMFDFLRRPDRRPNPPKPTGPVAPPVDQVEALAALGQSSFDTYYAPALSVSGQPQDWSWSPKTMFAVPGEWGANWNSLPPVFRVYYGKALAGGASAALLRQIYEQLEGHSSQEGANLVNVTTENGLVARIEGGQLVALRMNPGGVQTRTVLATLLYPDAPTKVTRL